MTGLLWNGTGVQKITGHPYLNITVSAFIAPGSSIYWAVLRISDQNRVSCGSWFYQNEVKMALIGLFDYRDRRDGCLKPLLYRLPFPFLGYFGIEIADNNTSQDRVEMDGMTQP